MRALVYVGGQGAAGALAFAAAPRPAAAASGAAVAALAWALGGARGLRLLLQRRHAPLLEAAHTPEARAAAARSLLSALRVDASAPLGRGSMLLLLMDCEACRPAAARAEDGALELLCALASPLPARVGGRRCLDAEAVVPAQLLALATGCAACVLPPCRELTLVGCLPARVLRFFDRLLDGARGARPTLRAAPADLAAALELRRAAEAALLLVLVACLMPASASAPRPGSSCPPA